MIDQRNAEPTVRRFKPADPESLITVGLELDLPDVDDLEPTVDVRGFNPEQPYRIVMAGEKSSLDPILAPLADQHRADLYLPTGEMSDTLSYRLAADAASDGRPLVVLYFADCDPAGWQMPVSVARKLQAFQVGHFSNLDVEEQFYLVMLGVVVMAMATGRRRVRRVALVLAVASTVWMAWLSLRSGFPVPNDPSRVYDGTDTHAMGLLVGAALATVWAAWRRWSPGASWLSRTRIPQPGAAVVIDVAGVLGLVGVGCFCLRVGEFFDFLYRGGFLVLALLTALGLAALANPAGVLGQIMSVQPLRHIGERSYGIYLWHWPVFMVTRPGFELPFDGAPAVLLRVGITLLLAEASYRLVEMPIRRGAIAVSLRKARESTPVGRAAAVRVVAVTLTLALVVWTVGVGLYRAPAQPSTPSEVTVATSGAEGTQANGPSADGRAREAERQPIRSPSPTPSSPATPTPSPAASDRDLSVFGDSVV